MHGGEVLEEVREHAVVSPLIVACVEEVGTVVECVMQSPILTQKFGPSCFDPIRPAGFGP